MSDVGDVTEGNTIPVDSDGRVYHVGCREGEISNKILICSSHDLAKEISTQFDEEHNFERLSNRGFHVYTGRYNGTRVTVIGFGIGFAMIDILLREVRRITTGKLYIVLIGIAPSPSNLSVNAVVNVVDAVAFQLDYQNFQRENPYQFFTQPYAADPVLSQKILIGLKMGGFNVREGRVCSSPSFVAGIAAPKDLPLNFKRDKLLSELQQKCGQIATLEMEAYPLFWLASRSSDSSIAVAAVSVVGSDLNRDLIQNVDALKSLVKIGRRVFEVFSDIE